MAKEFTTANFKEEVLDSKHPVLVDFKNKAVIGKVNVDSESEISSEYGITSIPTLLFFKDGEIVDKHIGSASKSQLEEKLNSLI
jgi:thioredoxin 1